MHKTADTSIENYHLRIKGNKEDGEDELVLEAIKKLQPCSGRSIWMYLNKRIENSSIARSLNNLKKKNKIICAFKAKCEITGIKVQQYTTVETDGQTAIF